MAMRDIIHELVPPILVKKYYVILRKMRDPRVCQLIGRNIALKGRHRDRYRCFIIGNGPSLQKQDLSLLKKEVVFVANFFNLHPQCQQVSPDYWCFADPNAFFPGTFGEHLEIDRSTWFKDICAKAPNAEFIVPASVKPAIERNNWLPGRSIWYVAFLGSSCEMGYAESDLTKLIPCGSGTIAALAIPAAIYMGFSKIYLLGCDCNWWVESLLKEDLEMSYVHFYNNNPFTRRGREACLRDFGLEEELRNLSNHFKSLRLLQEHALTLGVEIINATEGGILDVFPRSKLEDILA